MSNWMNDWNLNHSGDILEDMLGNNREMTLALRDAMKEDNRIRFKFIMVIGFLFGILGISFLFVSFIPAIISLWLLGMCAGMVVAGIFGRLFSIPVIDSVSVHLKVINYVDNVIRNTDWKPNNLMDGSITAEELIRNESDDDNDDEEIDGDDDDDEEAERPEFRS